MTKRVNINGRIIGPGQPPYILAEMSANHNGSLERAFETISAAHKCGADGIKIQTYTPDTLTIDCDRDDFKVEGGLWDGYTLYQLYQEAHTPYEWHKPLFEHAAALDFTIFSTPFDETAVDLLEDLNAPAYKIASFEAVDLPLIRYAASTKKPMIISTGMANFEEIEEAVQTARDAGCLELILLHCISAYPAPLDQANLATIQDLRKRFDLVVGLSDHTLGTLAPTATALGANFIEKHFTIDPNDKGPDSAFSISPPQLEELVTATREAWSSIGQPGYELKPAEQANRVFRRSLYFVKELKAGQEITAKDVRRIRPGYGLPPKLIDDVIGAKVKRDIDIGEPVRAHDLT